MNFFKVGLAVLIVALALVLNAQHFVSYEPMAKFSSPAISKPYTEKKAKDLDEAIEMALKITTNQLTFKLKSSGNSDVNYGFLHRHWPSQRSLLFNTKGALNERLQVIVFHQYGCHRVQYMLPSTSICVTSRSFLILAAYASGFFTFLYARFLPFL